MNNPRQKRTIVRLETVIIAFFVLAALSVLIVYFINPSIYAKVLKLEPVTTDRYPLASTLFLIALLIFISILIFGVTKHWRWLFWLLLIANSFSILEVPTTILQLAGIVPDPYPIWYSLYRMSIAILQVGIAIWMVRIYFQYGVWGMGKKMIG
ncbi:MAG: hypothetical protein ACXWPS_24110 [Ktedonobacteraceae bacterium]